MAAAALAAPAPDARAPGEATAARPLLSVERLLEIQAECLADDISFDAARLTACTEAEVYAFFEGGGVWVVTG